MAQADLSVVNKLRKAIVNISQAPRGHRLSDWLKRCLPSSSSSSLKKKGEELIKLVADQLDQHLFNSANNYFDNESPFQLQEIYLSGSQSEGTMKVNFDKKLSSDTDFMIVLKNIKVTEEDQAKGNLLVKEDTAFVTLYLTDENLIKTWADFVENSSHSQCESKVILSSMKLKERFRQNYLGFGPMFMPLAEENVEKVDEGPSVAVVSSLPAGNGNVYAGVSSNMPVAEYDLVLAIKCEGWPLCAHEWPTRSRCWPTQGIIQEIIKHGFHIVCKSSNQGNFRLSFSNAEAMLIQNLIDLQHKVYRAFKSFVNHYKNKWSPNIKKIFCSYHLKTIFLWYCEKTEPSDWNEDTVVSHLLSLIDELIMALRKRTLPMYFMPKHNLLEQMEDGRDVAEKITKLRCNICQISDAITSQEPNLASALMHMKSQIFLSCKLFYKCLAKKRFEPGDFIELIIKIFNMQDEFWLNVVGPGGCLPSRNDAAGYRLLSMIKNPLVEFLSDSCESLNIQYFGATEKSDDMEKENQLKRALEMYSNMIEKFNH